MKWSSHDARTRASELCDVLQRLCDDPSDRLAMAQQFRQEFEHEYFIDLFVDRLLINGDDGLPRVVPTVLKALQLAVDPNTPQDVRMELLCAFAPGKRFTNSKARLTRALHRDGGHKLCLNRLSQPDLSQLEQFAVRLLFEAQCDAKDREARDAAVADLCLSLASAEPDAGAEAARSLAALVGMDRPWWSLHSVKHITFFGDFQTVSVLERTDNCLSVLAAALVAVAPSVAANLAVVVSALAKNHMGKLLLGMVPALMELLDSPAANAAAAEALYFISKKDYGQETILAAKQQGSSYLDVPPPVSLLLKTALEAQGDAAKTAACVLGRLAFHPDARTALAHIRSRAANEDRALEVLTAAFSDTSASCQACENESVVSLLRLRTGPARGGVFCTISSIAKNGTLKQRKELVESGAVAYVVEALRIDAGNSVAWAALTNLISTETGREQALENNVAALLPAGLNEGGLAALYTMDTMNAISGSEKGAQAVASAGVIDAIPWPSLPAAKAGCPSLAAGEDTEAFLALEAAKALKNLIDRQPAVSAAKVRAEAATASISSDKDTIMDRTIALLINQPRTCLLWRGCESLERLLETLTQTEAGLEMARFALKGVVDGGPLRFENARLLTTLNLISRYDGIVASDPDTSKRIVMSYSAADQQGKMLTLDVISCLPVDTKKTLVREEKEFVQEVLLSFGKEDVAPEVKHFVNTFVSRVARFPGVSKMALGALPPMLEQCAVTPSHKKLFGFYVRRITTFMRAAEAAGEEERTEMAELLLEHKVLDVLQDAINSDPQIEGAAEDCCQLMGLLACTSDGKAAIRDLVSKGSIYTIKALLASGVQAREATQDLLLERLQHFLEHSMTSADQETTLRVIHSLCDAISKNIVVPIVPTLVKILEDAHDAGDFLKIGTKLAAQCISDLSKLGAAGLESVKQAGAFKILIPTMFAAAAAGADYVKYFIPILHNALGDASFASEAEGVIGELGDRLPDMIDFLQPNDSRTTVCIVKELVPLNNNVPAVIKARDLLGPKLIPKLCRAISTDDVWSRRRGLNSTIIDAMAGLCNWHEKNLQISTDCRVLETLLDAIEHGAGSPEVRKYAFVLGMWTFGKEHRFRNALVEAGGLRKMENILHEGPGLVEFGFCVQTLGLLAQDGNRSHREALAKCKAANIIFEWYLQGRIPMIRNGTVVRKMFLIISHCAQSNELAGQIVQKAIEGLQGDDPVTVSTSTETMVYIVSKRHEGAEYALEHGAMSALVSILTNEKLKKVVTNEKLKQVEADATSCLYFLARMVSKTVCSKETANAARACAKLVLKHLEEGTTERRAARVLSVLAEVSSKANATIRATVQRIAEEADEEDEGFAECVVNTLTAMCEHQVGTSVAVLAGAVPQGIQALTSARGKKLREAALKMLDQIAWNNYAGCLAMRDVIETALALVVKAFRVKKMRTPRELEASAPMTELIEQKFEKEEVHRTEFPYDVFLSHDWGNDELDRNNHERVARVNEQLKGAGVQTWFDGDQMRDNINKAMTDGIAGSKVILVFVTANFINKASGKGPRGEDDNCFFEFDSALIERGRGKILPVVMEPRCRAPSNWESGIVKGKLGSKLYVSLIDNEGEGSYNDGMKRLLQEISVLTGKTFTPEMLHPIEQAEPQEAQDDNDARVKNVDEHDGQQCGETIGSQDIGLDTSTGAAAMSLLVTLSEADTLRVAIESAKPLDAIEFICNSYPKYMSTALYLLVNIYSSRLTLDEISSNGSTNPDSDQAGFIDFQEFSQLLSNKGVSKTDLKAMFDRLDVNKDGKLNRKEFANHKASQVVTDRQSETFRVCALFDKFKVEERVVLKLSDSLHNCQHQGPRFIRFYLTLALALAGVSGRREKLTQAGLSGQLLKVFTEATQHNDGVTESDLALAADVVWRLSGPRSPQLRLELQKAGLDEALQAAIEKIQAFKEDDRTEGMVRLLQAAKQALQGLNGSLDNSLINPLLKRGRGTFQSTPWTEATMLELPTFQTFVSHKRSTAQDFARTLHSTIVSQGFSCFLDVENLDHIDDLSVIVAGCDAFIYVLSDGALESAYCCKELAAAVHAGVPVIIVSKEGARFPDKYKNNTEPFPSNALIDATFQGPFLGPCRDVFKTKAIQHSNEYFGAFSVALLKRIKEIVVKNASNGENDHSRVVGRRRKALHSLSLVSMSNESHLEQESLVKKDNLAQGPPVIRDPVRESQTAKQAQPVLSSHSQSSDEVQRYIRVLESTLELERKQHAETTSRISVLEEKLVVANMTSRDSDQVRERLHNVKAERKQQADVSKAQMVQLAVLEEKLAQANSCLRDSKDKLRDLEIDKGARMVQIAVLEEKLKQAEADASGARMVQMLEAQGRALISRESFSSPVCPTLSPLPQARPQGGSRRRVHKQDLVPLPPTGTPMGWETHLAGSVANDSEDGGSVGLRSQTVQQTVAGNESVVMQQLKDEIGKQQAQLKQHHADMEQLKKTSAMCILS